MTQLISLPVAGTLGSNGGAGSDGVLVGQIAAASPTKAILKSLAAAGLCYTDDGGTYVDYETELGEATGDDVPVLPATPANDDAVYFGHATSLFARVDVNLTTQGDGTWTITYQYWDGTQWSNLSGVTDGTTGFTATTGWKSITFTEPEDWEECTVDNVQAYWIRGVVSGYSAVTTQPLVGQGYIVTTTPTWTDDTTDFNDADAGDVALLPAYPIVGDGLYVGYSEPFCKLKVTTSQARTGTATVTLKYWDGSAWSSVTTVDDDSVGWSAAAGTLLVNFVPPDDWTACTAENGPNGQTGYFVVMELTAMTDVTQQPLATQGWVLPYQTGAGGVPCPSPGTITTVVMNALTASGSTGDSVFLLANITQGTFETLTWTKADARVSTTIALGVVASDEIVLIQITEDGTTEFADALFTMTL
jgi:hypothetical protein